jgi:cyclopropane-fatty-acyl-phospholipid synthase
MADHVFDRHKREVDFIKRYIFPGSCIPSVAAMLGSVAKKTDLRLFHLEDITPHYARTLRQWRSNFFSNIDRVRAMGFSEAFIRMWEYYLCYCEGGFAERYIGDVQMILAKPLSRAMPILPPIGPAPQEDPA